MSFTIYTAGDASFLSEVFNSVAMVSGSGAIASVAAVGALVTVLLLGFRAILEGGRAIRFEELFLGFIVYMVAFYPTTTVLIEDGYTGHVHPVDNVPLGPAAAGWAVSSVGYKLTTIFETGYRFSGHGSNDTLHRFAEPLELLTRLRSSSANPLLMNAWNAPFGANADVRRSWENYFKHCSLVKVDLGLITIDQMIHGDVMEVTRFDSDIYGTQLFLGPQGGSEHTCADAHTLLVQATNIATAPGSQADQILQAMITQGAEHDQVGGTVSATDKLTTAVSPLLGYGLDIQKFVNATILEPVFADAAEGKYKDMQDVASAIAFRQSLMQRNTQWAQEASAFMTVIRPAMTFFEGFVYAVTPMLAMLFVMGRFGMGLAGKYLQTIFWVQLWLPILSICNLYIRNAAEKQILATFSQADTFGLMNFQSFYAANNIAEIAESWLAVGSMLAAATPMLAFFLVSGSSYAFSNIAGRLGGQDHFDEKQVTPDTVNVGAAHDVAAMMKHSVGGGGMLSGTDGFVGEVSISEGYANELSSATANERAAQKGFTNSLSNAFKESVGQGREFSTIQGFTQAGMFSGSKTTGLDSSEVDSISKQFGVDRSVVEQNIKSVGASASLGLKIPGTEIGAGLTASTGKNWTQSEQERYADAITNAASQALSKGMGASLMEQMSNSIAQQGAEKFMSGAQSETAQQLSESAQAYNATREQLSKVSSRKDGYTNSQKYKYNEVGASIHRAGLGARLAGIIGSDSALNNAANNSSNMFAQAHGMSGNVARNAGMFNAVMQHGTSDQRLEALSLLSEATGGMSANGPLVDNSGLNGVDYGSVTPMAVQQLADQSGQKVAQADLAAAYSSGGAGVINTRNQERDRDSAMQTLERLANTPLSAATKLNATNLRSAEQTAISEAYRLSGGNSVITNSLLRAGNLSANQMSGRVDDFNNDLAPKLSAGAQGYLMEVRLGGNMPEYTEPAYQKWRDEYAERDASGSIMRNSDGSAVLSAENEKHLGVNKAILDKHQHTDSATAGVEIGAMSLANQRFGR